MRLHYVDDGLGAALGRRERLRGLVLMNTWAWELPSFLPPFLREFRTDGLGEILALAGNLFVESIPGGMHRRDVDPEVMDAYLVEDRPEAVTAALAEFAADC